MLSERHLRRVRQRLLVVVLLILGVGFFAGRCTAQVSFHPLVSVTRSKFPEPSGVWCVFDPVVDPFVWIGAQPGTKTIELREIHFLHPNGWTGACYPRLNQVAIASVNPTTFRWTQFHRWPLSPNALQSEFHSRALGNQMVLPPVAGYGVDYANYCAVGNRPLLVAVLLEVR